MLVASSWGLVQRHPDMARAGIESTTLPDNRSSLPSSSPSYQLPKVIYMARIRKGIFCNNLGQSVHASSTDYFCSRSTWITPVWTMTMLLPVCVFRWDFSTPADTKLRPHMLHLYGFSPVCERTCCFRWLDFLKPLLQMEHLRETNHNAANSFKIAPCPMTVLQTGTYTNWIQTDQS